MFFSIRCDTICVYVCLFVSLCVCGAFVCICVHIYMIGVLFPLCFDLSRQNNKLQIQDTLPFLPPPIIFSYYPSSPLVLYSILSHLGR
ncbi:hypothetical protein F4810DRAFT_646027 [Camillea tinctor]|nr:hypothetical protein F4810DRAFT_646027 [Camillea tinctor]